MRQYFFMLTAASVITSVVLLLAPGGEKGKTGRIVAFAGALILMVVMLKPLPAVLKNKISIPKNESESAYSNEKNEAEYFAGMAGRTLMSVYGCEAQEIRAKAVYSEEGKIETLFLYVKESADIDRKEAEKILAKIYGIKVKVEGDG